MPRPARIEEIIDGTRKLRPPKPGKSLQECFPDVAKQWCQEKNGDVTPADISGVSGVVVWWHCEVCGGDYDMKVAHKTTSHCQCPYCMRQRPLKDFNTLQACAPRLAEELSAANPFTADEILCTSNQMAIWECPDCQHKWNEVIKYRIMQGKTCPVCHRHTEPVRLPPFPGKGPAQCHLPVEERKLKHHNPELLSEWDYEENTRRGLTPDITFGSSAKAAWICPHGHHYDARVSHRTGTSHTGCPYCAGTQVLKNVSDLATTHPDLARELDGKASGFDATEVSAGNTTADAVWNCPVCHYQYHARIVERTHGSGCPRCSRIISNKAARLPRKGLTFAEGASDELKDEWSSKNERGMNTVSLHSGYRAWWVCSNCHHEWQTAVANRVNGSRCPKCGATHTSFAEQALVYYVSQALPESIVLNGYVIRENNTPIPPVDVAIPSMKIAIEHDGEFWHRNRLERDLRKQQAIEEAGWTVWRIREIQKQDGSANSTLFSHCFTYLGVPSWTHEKFVNISNVIAKLIKEAFSVDLDVDAERDQPAILALYKTNRQKESVANIRPELISEWGQQNSPLTLDLFTRGSSYRAWWKCQVCGHEWQTAISNRVNGTGCPICAHRRLSS